MKIHTSITMIATSLVVAGWAGAAFAQAADQTAQSPRAVAAPDAATAVPDQTQAPASGATTVASTMTNGPIPDTPANRARYGAPMSHAGKRTAPAGN